MFLQAARRQAARRSQDHNHTRPHHTGARTGRWTDSRGGKKLDRPRPLFSASSSWLSLLLLLSSLLLLWGNTRECRTQLRTHCSADRRHLAPWRPDKIADRWGRCRGRARLRHSGIVAADSSRRRAPAQTRPWGCSTTSSPQAWPPSGDWSGSACRPPSAHPRRTRLA